VNQTLANLWSFAKFAKVSPRQCFPLYGKWFAQQLFMLEMWVNAPLGTSFFVQLIHFNTIFGHRLKGFIERLASEASLTDIVTSTGLALALPFPLKCLPCMV